MHPRIPLAFLAARAHCWLIVNLSSTRTPRSLSAELLSSRSTPSLLWRWRLHNLAVSPPRCTDPALMLEERSLRVCWNEHVAKAGSQNCSQGRLTIRIHRFKAAFWHNAFHQQGNTTENLLPGYSCSWKFFCETDWISMSLLPHIFPTQLSSLFFYWNLCDWKIKRRRRTRERHWHYCRVIYFFL